MIVTEPIISVVGGTGAQGGGVVDALLAARKFKVTLHEVSALPRSLSVSLRTPAHNFSVAQKRVGVTSKRRQCSCRTCQTIYC